MNRDRLAHGLAIVGALVAWAALALQCALTLDAFFAAGGTLLRAAWRLVGYFTILTNLLVAVAFTFAALRYERRLGLNAPRSELATATAIAMVGLVYSLLLRWVWSPQGWSKLADALLHDVAPVLFVAYFLLRPRPRLALSDAAFALIFPLLYVVYALARGAADGWYAYWFLDPSKLAAARMGLNVVLLAFAFGGMALVLAFLSNRVNATARKALPWQEELR